MRYAMRAKIQPGKAAALKQALQDGSFSRGFPYGDLGEALRESVADDKGTLQWVEVCYCREYYNVAMVEELVYLEKYLHAIEVGDARDPRFCDGYPVCNDCQCTDSVRYKGVPFDEFLEKAIAREHGQNIQGEIVPTRWTGWRGEVQTEEEKSRNQGCMLKP